MKSYFFTFILTVLFIASTFTASYAQIDWTKYAGNPVLPVGSPGSWDDRNVGTQSVIFDGTTYHMWYSGNLPSTSGGIGYATSPDGINWTKHSGNPVLQPGSPGNWDEATVYEPFVVFDGSVFHMWYTGAADTLLFGPIFIGYATSSNGCAWTKHPGNPVLSPGTPGSWDDTWIDSHCIIYVNGTYHMWYGAWNGTPEQIRIGHATSPDGVTWIRDPNNPVLSYGSFGSWDFPRVEGPNVVYDGVTFHMWYSAGDWFAWRIGYATSQDGSAWTKFACNPVLNWGSAGSWDDIAVGFSSVILDTATSTYKMWYTGSDIISNSQIGYATAPVTIIHVPGVVATIQEAIDIASDGNVVLVADGTYQENINFKGKAITVASHYYMDGDTSHISNTIIDGSNPSNADSGSVVSFVSGEDTTSVLYGFTITNGSGTITEYSWIGVVYPTRAGGGIFCHNSGARICHNKIINNHIPNYANSAGGGVSGFPIGNTAHVIIDNNQIVYNSVTGVDAWSGGVDIVCNGTIKNNDISFNTSNATSNAWSAVNCWAEPSNPRNVLVKNNLIKHNTSNGINYALGGGVTITAGMNVSVIGNEISYNVLNATNYGRGGGILVDDRTGTTIIDRNTMSNNMVNGNVATGGGISLRNNSSSLTLITNNIISGNSALDGGGIHSRNSNDQIINNTIVNNSATTGGGIYTQTSRPVVMNSIVWYNTAPSDPGIHYVDGTPHVVYSDVQGGWTGPGNMSIDPLFVPGDSLYHLMSTTDTSMCLNTGADSIQISGVWYAAPPIDRGGNPRPNPAGTPPDMGAWESDVINSLEEIKGLPFPKTFALKQNYPNPFNPSTTIEFSIPKSEYVTLKVYNLLGQEVVTLVSEKLKAGSYNYSWDAGSLASGVYLYELKAGDPSAGSGQRFVKTRKMILLR